MENLNMFVGKIISSVVLGSDDKLHFIFEDKSKMMLWDDGAMCCERRYMTIDDDLSFFVGTRLVSVEVRDAPDLGSPYNSDNDTMHEVQFVEIMTNRGCFTVASHNEHNGFYSGFSVSIESE